MISNLHAIIYAAVGLVPTWLLWNWIRNRSRINPRRLPFPPGPKGLPLLGNLFDLPTTFPEVTLAEWAKTYGDLMHFNILGTRMLYINSFAAVNDLFDKRSSIYSGRPRLPMVKEVMKIDWSFSLAEYGPNWRKQRRIFHEFFNVNAVTSYQPSQLLEARRLLGRLLETPENFSEHIRYAIAGTILRVTYGIEVATSNDKFVALAEAALLCMSQALQPGAFLVDVLPFLKFVPEWFPGAHFKRLAKLWRQTIEKMKDLPYEETKQAIAQGTGVPCALIDMLTDFLKNEENTEEELLIKGTAATALAGGADTTVSTLQCFFLAMAMNPGLQTKAQAELDKVVGKDRLPDFGDRDSLPQVEAIVMESLRWHPVVPLGIPHQLDEDDEYRGYFIPKGTIVFPNIWGLLHDETVYPDPLAFKPERFLDENGRINKAVPHPNTACFGFGRRVCPGQHLASNAVFISIASVLASFEIGPVCDEQGNQILIENAVLPGMLAFPKPFKCTIKPRSSEIEALIRQVDQSLQGSRKDEIIHGQGSQ